MSYKQRQVPLRGLGYDFVIGTPIGSQKFVLPVEKLANDAANIAVSNAQKGLVAVTDAAVGELKKRVPEITATVMPVIQKQVLPPLLKQVTDTAVNELWPQMKPKVESEIIFAGAILAAAMIIPLAGVTLYLRREIRRGKA